MDSPISLESGRSFVDWDTEEVVELFEDLGLDYGHAIRDSRIDGATLAWMNDHQTLKDLGITSVGQRLSVLRAVYELKLRDGITMAHDDYCPPYPTDDPHDHYAHDKDTGQHHRLEKLEDELMHTRSELHELRHLLKDLARKTVDLEVQLSSQSTLSSRSRHDRKPSLSVDTTGYPTREPGSTPTPTTTSHPPLPTIQETEPLKKPSRMQHRKEMSSPDILVSDVASPENTPKSANNANRRMQVTAASPLTAEEVNGINLASTPLFSATFAANSLPNPLIDSPGKRPVMQRSASSNSASASSGKKSSDTCLQVLPAAVKKYGLKKRWTEYAMVVAWGKEKRVLSYDERPRMVIHELRQQGEAPSCLVQHESELKSPLVNAASRKTKLFRRFVDESTAPKPELTPQKLPILVKNGRSLPDDVRDRLPKTIEYCFSVTMFLAEDSNDIDAEYGECFSLLNDEGNKVKIQKANGQTGLVPFTILLESYLPNPIRIGSRATTLNTSCIASLFEISWALVDRVTSQQGELDLTKGDRLRLYARCAHWCFVAKEKTTEAGWAPSWVLSSPLSSTSGDRSESSSPVRRL